MQGSEGIVKIGEKQIMEVKSWSLEEVCDTVDTSIIRDAVAEESSNYRRMAATNITKQPEWLSVKESEKFLKS